MTDFESGGLHILSLSLRNFRNYAAEQVTFSPGFNSVFGSNAQGKTNLLEALFLFVSGRSFRAKQVSDWLFQGADSFALEVQFQKRGFTQRLTMWGDRSQRRIRYNDSPLQSLKELLGILPAVLACPDDNLLIKGAPSVRRQFLDLQLSQVDPLYLHHLSRYSRALKQRNQLLRRGSDETLPVWEQELAKSGAYIIEKRRQCVEQLQQLAQKLHGELAEEAGELTIAYQTCLRKVAHMQEGVATLQEQYQRQRQREKQLGNTLVGPHRDDIGWHIDSRPARIFGSEGQQRSVLMALKLAEWHLLKKRSGEVPLLLIDDVGQALDRDRRMRLFELLGKQGQVLVTAPDAIEISSKVMHPPRYLSVEKGRVALVPSLHTSLSQSCVPCP